MIKLKLYSEFFLSILLLFILQVTTNVATSKPIKSATFLKGKPTITDLKRLNNRPYKLLGEDGNGGYYFITQRPKITLFIPTPTIVIGKRRYRTSILHFDKKLNLIAETKINYKNVDGLKNPFYTGGINYFLISYIPLIISTKNQFQPFEWNGTQYAICPKRYNRSILYKVNLDISNAELSNISELINIKSEYQIKAQNPFYIISFSSDSSHLCISSIYNKKNGSQSYIYNAVFTKGFKLKYSSNILISNSLNDFKIENISVSNFGEIIITKINHKKNKISKIENTSFYFIDENNKAPTEQKLKYDGKLLNNTIIQFNKKGTPLLAGEINSGNTESKKFYVTQLNDELKIKKPRLYTIRKKNISNFNQDLGNTENENFSTKNLYFNELLPTSDSGYLMITFKYDRKKNYGTPILTETGNSYFEEECSSNPENPDGYVHILGDFIFIKLNKGKKVEWISMLPRNFKEVNYCNFITSISKYKTLETNGLLYMIFSNNNKETGIQKINPFWRDFTTKIARINLKTGATDCQDLSTDKSMSKYAILGNKTFFTKNNEILFFGFQKNFTGLILNYNLKVGKIKLP